MTGDGIKDAPGEAEPWRYILSAGRTGTMFLEAFFNRHCPGVTAIHEPPPSRQHLMLANLRNDWGVGGALLAWHFRKSRVERLSAHAGYYVEINPMLCPLTDLLADPARPLRVVHIVREPASWTRSMLGFRASTRFRDVIDHIPLATPFPSPRPAGWRQMDLAARTLWRWHWCNSRIAELRDATPHYCLIRYEDLFAGPQQRATALRRILETLDLPYAVEPDAGEFSERRNPAVEEAPLPDAGLVRAICGPLASEMGYSS